MSNQTATTGTRPVTLQAIQTRYLGPTNTRGSRVKAVCDAGSLIQSWNYSLDGPGNHRAVALALQAKLGWSEWALETGCLPGGDMCHVQTMCPLIPNDRA
ncbi:MAG: hypothetical protein ACTS5I_00215 [Rhodanobacter sp.]